MKYKKTLVSFLILVMVFGIYQMYSKKDFYYVALGDSLAAGVNAYGESGYGYVNYVENYLKKNRLLKSSIGSFTASGYKTTDLIDDIDHNRSVTEKEKSYSIRRELRESDLVTISIGANDIFAEIDMSQLNFSDITPYLKAIDKIIPNLDESIKKVREYAKGEIIIVGYYNPIPFLFNTNETEMDDLFQHLDSVYQKVAKKYKCTYISTYQTFKKGKDYLPNPSDFHPNTKGYEALAKEIITFLDRDLLN